METNSKYGIYILIELRMINIFRIIARGVSLVGSVFGAIRNRMDRSVLLLGSEWRKRWIRKNMLCLWHCAMCWCSAGDFDRSTIHEFELGAVRCK